MSVTLCMQIGVLGSMHCHKALPYRTSNLHLYIALLYCTIYSIALQTKWESLFLCVLEINYKITLHFCKITLVFKKNKWFFFCNYYFNFFILSCRKKLPYPNALLYFSTHLHYYISIPFCTTIFKYSITLLNNIKHLNVSILLTYFTTLLHCYITLLCCTSIVLVYTPVNTHVID